MTGGDITENSYTFTGKRFDEESGMYHFHFRNYDPTTGVWTAPDPIGIIGGINLYSYVSNNPVNFRDWLGLWKGAGADRDTDIDSEGNISGGAGLEGNEEEGYLDTIDKIETRDRQNPNIGEVEDVETIYSAESRRRNLTIYAGYRMKVYDDLIINKTIYIREMGPNLYGVKITEANEAWEDATLEMVDIVDGQTEKKGEEDCK